MKKLLFVNSSLSGGGSERAMTVLANGFAEKKYDVSMVLVREYDETYEVSSKINLIKFKYNTRNKIVIAFKRLYKLRKLIKNGNYDYIISFMYDINIETLISSIGIKVPIIVSERNNPMARKNKIISNFLQNLLYKKAKFIVFQTETVKKMFPLNLQKKGIVIPNAINSSLPNVWEGKREKIVVAVGRLVPQKNFSLLIKAFSIFHTNYLDYKLIIYGKGSLLNDLKKEVESLNLSNYVEFPGYVVDVSERMRKSSMYVSTSDYEGMSNSILEALAMGIPSICTDCPVGGTKMVIKNNINGILIPVGDEKSLIEAMNKIASNKEFADNLSKEAIKVKEELSIDNIVKIWENLFD